MTDASTATVLWLLLILVDIRKLSVIYGTDVRCAKLRQNHGRQLGQVMCIFNEGTCSLSPIMGEVILVQLNKAGNPRLL